MIHYLLEFRADGRSVTVHKRDDGAYDVERSGIPIATCNEFPDALGIFRYHVHQLEDDVLSQELGK